MRATRHLPEFFRLVWETNRFYSALIVLLRALRAAIPIATLWIGKLIIDEVVRVLGEPGVAASGIQAYRHVLLLVGVGRVAIVGEILARASSLLESLLGDLFANRTSVN
jgi:ATP-binding cassette subfamily B protein